MIDKSFYKWLNSYGWKVIDEIKSSGPISWQYNDVDYHIGMKPFYATPSAYLNTVIEAWVDPGSFALLWSKVANIGQGDNKHGAYNFGVAGNFIYPSVEDVNRQYGESLRCLTQ